MDDKVSVSIRQTDDGKYIFNRSWNEGEGKESKYKSEEVVMNADELPPDLKKMFQKGAYATAKKSVFEKASEDMDRNGFKKEMMGK